MPTILTIPVTTKHLTEGTYRNPYACPLAQAAKEALP